jgi:hypothetical protein
MERLVYPQPQRRGRERAHSDLIVIEGLRMNLRQLNDKGGGATEMALAVLAYNFTRVMNILGVKPLIAAMRE